MSAHSPSTAGRGILSWAPAIAIAAISLIAGANTSLAQDATAALPPQASARAEAQFDGELEVLYEEHAQGARLLHYLHVGNGRRLRLQFEGLAPDLETGTRVRARGRLQNEALTVSSGSGGVQALAIASPNTFGDQRVIVILVNFQDNPSTPYSAASAYSTTFQAASDFYQENSYGQTSLSGDVFGWFTLPMNSTTCDTNQVATLAEQAAKNAGVNVTAYSRKIYAFPQISACSWWGLGSVGGNPSRAWINGSYATQVVAHELGHNFGNHHSHSQPCAAGTCSSVEYGDDRDIMGNRAVAHTTSFQKERLGWLNYGASPPIQTVGQTGTYWIDGYASLGASPKALKILKSVDSSGGRTWYYLEARTPFGFDASIGSGVLVHTGSESVASSSYQIDLDPVSSAFDSLLDVGQTFSDAAIGLTVKTLSADATGALVDVTFDAPPCVEAPPTVALAPATVTTLPGTAVGLTVTVGNKNSAACGATPFNLSPAVPAGWLASLAAPSLSPQPGGSASTTLTVTPPVAAAGSSGFTVSASQPASQASVSGTVVVATGLDVSVGVVQAKSGVTFSAGVAAAGQPTVNTSVTFTLTNPAGATTRLSALTGANGVATVKWRPGRKDPPGVYQVRADASAGGLAGTAATTFVR